MPQTLFITGASTGIGKITALHFRSQGWNVAATLRNPATDTELAAAGVQTFALDVTDKRTIQPALDGALAAFGRIDVLVNNAGYGTFGPFEAATDEQIERQYATNVTGLMYVTRAFLPHFRANRAGIIINISSVGGVCTLPFYSLYHGTKWAIEGFSESLNFELNGLGITVKLVEPGAIATDFGSRSLDRLKKDGLDAYDPLMKTFLETWAAARVRSAPQIVAEAIWQAATDGTSQLRYIVGDDAKALIEARGKISQAEYYAMIRQRLGL